MKILALADLHLRENKPECRAEEEDWLKAIEDKIMTLQALQEAIARLIIKRAENHGNAEEQERINKKLTKLYDLKFTLLSQSK